MQGTGIGSALRKARLLRGKSLEEASRETRIRADFLRALERERFEALLGDVYVRGCLRSYSSYLGLDPNGLLTVYSREFGATRVKLAHPPVATIEATAPTRSHLPHPHLPPLTRLSLTWPFLIGAALLLLAALGAVGVLSRSKAVPSTGGAPAPRASIPVLASTVTVDIQAKAPVVAVVRIDGRKAQRFELRKGEGRSFQGSTRIDVSLDHGGDAIIEVNGHSLGVQGTFRSAFVASFGPEDFRASPRPEGSRRPSPSLSPRP